MSLPLLLRPARRRWRYDLTAGVLPPVLSVARASTATYISAPGLITSAAANTARFDFDPITLQCRGMLVEPQRTNNSTQSENATSWAGANVSVTSDIAVSPSGTNSADKLIPTSSNASHYYGPPSFSMTSGVVYVFSLFAKASELSVLQIIGLSNIPIASNFFANFNLSTGTIGNVGAGVPSCSIQHVGNGWYRCVVSGVASTSASGRFGVAPLPSDGTARAPSFAGDGSSGVLVWGAQTEADDLSSYIPTGAASATRDADALTLLDTIRPYRITYEPLTGGSAQTLDVAAGQQPPATPGRWLSIQQQ